MKNLTVKDLIALLNTMDPDALVVAHAGDDNEYAYVEACDVYEDNGKCYINGYGDLL